MQPPTFVNSVVQRSSDVKPSQPMMETEKSLTVAVERALVPHPVLDDYAAGYIRKCVDTLIILCQCYGFETTGYKRKGTYDHWIKCAAIAGNPMKFVKYKTAAFFAYWAGELWDKQELPPDKWDLVKDNIDNPAVLLGGKGYKWIRSLYRSDVEKFKIFVTNILYAKKGMPRPDKKQLVQAEFDTARSLGTPSPQLPSKWVASWDYISSAGEKPNSPPLDYFLTKDRVISELERTVDELFDGCEYTMSDRMRPFFPSTSANYINSRVGAGAVGTFLADEGMIGDLRTNNPLITLKVQETKSGPIVHYNDEPLQDTFAEFWIRVLEKANSEPAIVKMVGLAEALKVRTISKGPPYIYTALKPLQNFLRKHLSKLRCFKLTGEPVGDAYIQEQLGKKLGKDEMFYSIDYQAATDDMHSYVSETIMNRISDKLKLTAIEREIAITALTKHQILAWPTLEEYMLPEAKRSPGFLIDQKRGQLMGSIMSFPILCIANFAVIRWAKELADLRVWKQKDAPICVNGDDGLTKINPLGKKIHEQLAAFVGLAPSVGKVYYSKKFMNINSVTYEYNPDGWRSEILQGEKGPYTKLHCYKNLPFVNLGLLYGFTRSSGTENSLVQDENSSSIGSRARDIVMYSPEFCREKVLSQFIWINDERLKRYAIPWFIPENLGGLGLPMILGTKYVADELYLKLARIIRENPHLLPLPSERNFTEWQLWKIARDSLPRLDFDKLFSSSPIQEKSEDMLSVQDVFGKAVIALMFNKSIDINAMKLQSKKVLKEQKKRKVHYLRSLEKTWKKALGLMNQIQVPKAYLIERPDFESSYQFKAGPPEPYAQEYLPTDYNIQKQKFIIDVSNTKLISLSDYHLDESEPPKAGGGPLDQYGSRILNLEFVNAENPRVHS